MMIKRVYLELILIIWTTCLSTGLWSFEIAAAATTARTRTSSITFRRVYRSLSYVPLSRTPIVCYQSTKRSNNLQEQNDNYKTTTNNNNNNNNNNNEAIQHMATFLTVRGGLLLLRLVQEKVNAKNKNNNITTTATTIQQLSTSNEDISIVLIPSKETSTAADDISIVSSQLVDDSDIESNYTLLEPNQQEKLDTEVPSSLHKKEGDRIIALKDEFSPSGNNDVSERIETVTTESVVNNYSESISDTTAVTDAILLERQDTATSSSLTTATDEKNGKADTESISQNYVPPIPEAISLGFGRSLPVEASGVVALRN